METTAQLFKALSEETRLRILALLMDGERCVCELMEVLGMPQSTISRHLSYLKNSGWVSGERRGVWMYYRLREERSAFADRLLAILAPHLAATGQGRADRERLAEMADGKQDACGG